MGEPRPTRRLLVGLTVTLLLAGCATGASPTPVPASPTQVVIPSAAVATPAPVTPAPAPTATPSPMALTDQALMDELAALWSGPYDAAKVAALYAPDAVFHDNVANETSTGLEAIDAKVKAYAHVGFNVKNTTAPIRQGDFLADFQTFGTGTDMSPGLGVVEIKDGKVQNTWVYPAGSSPATASPTSESPAALTDQALMDELTALWSSPYDAAKVAALYAPDAVFHDNVANETSTGLEAIGAKVKEYAALGFKVANTTAPIRQGDFLAVFQTFGAGGDTSPGLGVVEIKDGKVQNMWEYPAG